MGYLTILLKINVCMCFFAFFFYLSLIKKCDFWNRGVCWLRGCNVVHSSHKNCITHHWIGNWTSYKSIYNILINDQFKTPKRQPNGYTHTYFEQYKFRFAPTVIGSIQKVFLDILSRSSKELDI